ncbi:unnamed protein product [Lathyrus sativus]|nr:unnamed protein product [Lathyrus sativus]
MALWMEKGSEPLTETEKADLEAIAAIKESSAFELKEKGNQYVKMGKKHYSDAIDCYTRAINQKALGDSETSILFSNKALVNLLLGRSMDMRPFESAIVPLLKDPGSPLYPKRPGLPESLENSTKANMNTLIDTAGTEDAVICSAGRPK